MVRREGGREKEKKAFIPHFPITCEIRVIWCDAPVERGTTYRAGRELFEAIDSASSWNVSD